ncbi:MAG: flagellar assembly protein FliH [Zoogloeaceae bacterium]|jgi:flagellar assembly protein FliH|nr:flagellar assembly protein FliH [Zoogloeaceae bacterium]
MTTGGVIRGDKLTGYTRWQAEDFSAPAERQRPKEADIPPEEPPPPQMPVEPVMEEAEESEPEVEVSHVILPQEGLSLPTAEEIEQIHEEARQNGYRVGFGEGRTAGYEEGLRAGHAEGYQESFDSGRQAGFQESSAAVKQYEEEIQRICQGLQGAMAVFDQEMAEAVLACALKIAEQLTRTAIRVQPEMLLPIIQDAIAALPLHHGPITLFLAQADLEVVHKHLESQFAQEGWVMQMDESLKPGDFRISSGASDVDARMENRWQRVLEGIGISTEWLEKRL